MAKTEDTFKKEGKDKELNFDNFDSFESKEDDFNFNDDFDDKSRSPIQKVKHHVSKTILSTTENAIPAFRSKIEDRMPNTSSMINDADKLISDASYLKDQFLRDITPTIQSLKQSGQRLKPHVEGLLPSPLKKLYDKATHIEKVTEAPKKSKEQLQKESIDSEISAVLGAQFQSTIEADKENKRDKLIDRALADNRHRQDFRQFSVIRTASEFQVNFLRNAQLPYMKKSLELKLRHIYISKEIRDRLKGVAQVIETKLDQIRHNTGLPDMQKRILGEGVKGKLKDTANEKIAGFLTNIIKNLQNNILDPAKNSLEMASSGAEMLGMSLGEKGSALNTLLSLGSFIGGNLLGGYLGDKLVGNGYSSTGILGNRIKKFDSNFQDIRKLLFMTLANKANISENSGGISGWLFNSLFGNLINHSGPSFKNSQMVNLDGATGWKNKDSIALTNVIPKLLSKQLQQLTILTTGNRKTEELVYDYTKQDFIKLSSKQEIVDKALRGTKEDRKKEVIESLSTIRAAAAKSGSKLYNIKSFNDILPEIYKLIVSMGQRGYVFIPDAIHLYLSGQDTKKIKVDYSNDADIQLENEEFDRNITVDDYINSILKDIKKENRRPLLTLLDSLFYPDGENLNKNIVRTFNRQCIIHYEKTDKYKSIIAGLEQQGQLNVAKEYIKQYGSTISLSNDKMLSDTMEDVKDALNSKEFRETYKSKIIEINDLKKKIQEERNKNYGLFGNWISRGFDRGLDLSENLPKKVNEINNWIGEKVNTVVDFAIDHTPQGLKNILEDRKEYYNRKKYREKQKKKEAKRRQLLDSNQGIIQEDLQNNIQKDIEEDNNYSFNPFGNINVGNVSLDPSTISVFKDMRNQISNLPERLTEKILQVKIVNFDDFHIFSSSSNKSSSNKNTNLTDGEKLQQDAQRVHEFLSNSSNDSNSDQNKPFKNKLIDFFGNFLGNSPLTNNAIDQSNKNIPTSLLNMFSGGMFGAAANLTNLGVNVSRSALEKSGFLVPDTIKPVTTRLDTIIDILKSQVYANTSVDLNSIILNNVKENKGLFSRFKSAFIKGKGKAKEKKDELTPEAKKVILQGRSRLGKLWDGTWNLGASTLEWGAGIYSRVLKKEWELFKKAKSGLGTFLFGGTEGEGEETQEKKGIFKRFGEAFTSGKNIFSSKKNQLKDKAKEYTFIDIYRKDEIEKDPLLTASRQKEGVYFSDGKIVKSSYLINRPVMSSDMLVTYISEEDIKHGLVDANNKPLDKLGQAKDLANKGINKGKGLWGKFQAKGGISGLLGGALGLTGGLIGSAKDLAGKLLPGYLNFYGNLISGGFNLAKTVGKGIFSGGRISVKPITKRLDTIIDILNWKFGFNFEPEPDTEEETEDKRSIPDKIKDKFAESRDKWFSKKTKSEQDNKSSIEQGTLPGVNPLEDRRRRAEEKEEDEEKSDRKSLVSSMKTLAKGLVGDDKDKKKGIFGKLLAAFGVITAPIVGTYKAIKKVVKGIFGVGRLLRFLGGGTFKLLTNLITFVRAGSLSGIGNMLGGLGGKLGGLLGGKFGWLKKAAVGAGAALGGTYLMDKMFGGGTAQAAELGDGMDSQDMDESGMEIPGESSGFGLSGTDMMLGAGTLAAGALSNKFSMKDVATDIGTQVAVDKGIEKATTNAVGKSVANNAAKQGFKLGAKQLAKTAITKVASSTLARGAAMILGGPVGWAITAGSIVLPLLAETKMGKSFMRKIGFGDSDEVKFRRDLYGIDKDISINDVVELEEKTKEAIQNNTEISDKDIAYFCKEMLDVKDLSGLRALSQIVRKHSSGSGIPFFKFADIAYDYFKTWYKQRFLPIFAQIFTFLNENNITLEQVSDLDDETKKQVNNIFTQIKNQVVSQNGNIELNKKTLQELVDAKRKELDNKTNLSGSESINQSEQTVSSSEEVNGNIPSTNNSDRQNKIDQKVNSVKNPEQVISDLTANSELVSASNSVLQGVKVEDSVNARMKLYGIVSENRIFGQDTYLLMLQLEKEVNACIDNHTDFSDDRLKYYAYHFLKGSSLNNIATIAGRINDFINPLKWAAKGLGLAKTADPYASKNINDPAVYFTAWFKRRFLPIFVEFKKIAANNNLEVTKVDLASIDIRKKIITELTQKANSIISSNNIILGQKEYENFIKESLKKSKELDKDINKKDQAYKNYVEDHGANASANDSKYSPSVSQNEVLREQSTKSNENVNNQVDANKVIQEINKYALDNGSTNNQNANVNVNDIMSEINKYALDDGTSNVKNDFSELNKIYSGSNTPGMDLGKINVPNLPSSSGSVSDLGKYVKRFESGKGGPLTVAWDSTGGTSYGSYQVAAIPGSAKEFVNWAGKNGGEFGKKFAEAMWLANKHLPFGGGKNGLDTGSKIGPTVDVWKKFASSNPEGFNKLEHEFIKRKHYDAALKLLPGEIRQAVENDRGLQEALWSTAIQHGVGGARNVFVQAWQKSGGKGGPEFIKAIYSIRGTKFGSSTANVRQSVQNRFKEEVGIILGLSQQQKPIGSEDTEVAQNVNEESPSIASGGNSVQPGTDTTGGNTMAPSSSVQVSDGNSMSNLNNVTPDNPSGNSYSSDDAPTIPSGGNSVQASIDGSESSEKPKDETQGTASGGVGSDKAAKAADIATSRAKPKSIKRCAQFTREALEQAGYPIKPSGDAWEWVGNRALERIGFTQIDPKSQPMKGDVAIIGKNAKHKYGHAQIWNGNTWVSDFVQRYKPYGPYGTIGKDPDQSFNLYRDVEGGSSQDSQGEGSTQVASSDDTNVNVSDNNTMSAVATNASFDSGNTPSATPAVAETNLPAVQPETTPAVQTQPVESAKSESQFDPQVFTSIDKGIQQIASILDRMLTVQQSMAEALGKNNSSMQNNNSNNNYQQASAGNGNAPISMNKLSTT